MANNAPGTATNLGTCELRNLLSAKEYRYLYRIFHQLFAEGNGNLKVGIRRGKIEYMIQEKYFDDFTSEDGCK